MKKSKPLNDLTGKRFGRLTALEYVGNSRWLCACDCGTKKEISTYNLSSGASKSCGCLNVENIHKRRRNSVDLIGKRFGQLEVIEYVKSDKKGTYWKCFCHACGNYCVKCASYLPQISTCGCGETNNKLKNMAKAVKNNCVEDTNIRLAKKKDPNQNNKIGVRGVWYNKNTDRYVAYISFQKKKRIIGRYKTLEEAKCARKQAEKERDAVLEDIIDNLKQTDLEV